jgi:hypothetical protein
MTCWCQGLGGQLLGNRVQDVSLLKRLQETEIVTRTFRDFEVEHDLSKMLQTDTMGSPTTAIIPLV